MKKFAKIMLIAGSILAIGSGVVLSYLYAQPRERPSDLTLANIEALAVDDLGLERDYDVTLEDGTRGRCIGIGDCFYVDGQWFPGEWIPRV